MTARKLPAWANPALGPLPNLGLGHFRPGARRGLLMVGSQKEIA
jgi:hypothetical protein